MKPMRSFDYAFFEGSVGRMNTSLFVEGTEWVQVLRLIVAALLALAIAYGIGLTGGLITVIAILFMPMLPHSPQLALMRFGAGILGFGGGWLIAYQFVDQPWLLLLVLWSNAYFWFYMMATGLPFLIMMALGLLPVLVVWMVYAGVTSAQVADSTAQYLVGIFAAETVGLLWPNTGETRVRKAAAASLRQFSDRIRTGYGSNREVRTRIGKAEWMPSLSLGFNVLLGFARDEMGAESRRFRQIAGLVENVRHLAAWPRVYSSFIRSGRFDQWMVDLKKERGAVHEALYNSMETLATAIEKRRPADDQLELEESLRVFDERSRAWVKENKEELSLETIALVEARCHYAQVVIYRVREIVKFTRDQRIHDEDSDEDIPSVSLKSFFTAFDPKVGLFAFKSVICIFLGFVVASLYPNWGGSLVILLMSGFLAPLTVGGLTVNFIDRIWGLLLAAIVALIVITTLIPDLVEVGQLLAVVAVALLPGVLLALKPKTASMGLSYAMGMLFMLTSSNHPSVSLDPIQERFLSVGGATLICYLVFRVLMPSKSADLVTGRMASVFTAVGRLIRTGDIKDGDLVDIEWQGKKIRHAAVRACGGFDQLVNDLDSESSAPEHMVRVRRHIVEIINSHMLLAATKSSLSMKRELLDYPKICEAVNQTVESLAQVEDKLAEVVESIDEHDSLEELKKEVVARIAHERQVILDSGMVDHLHEGTELSDVARVFLAEHAHHFTLHTYQHEIYRTLLMRDMLTDAVRTEFFGRTA